jgi:hypothetical protein
MAGMMASADELPLIGSWRQKKWAKQEDPQTCLEPLKPMARADRAPNDAASRRSSLGAATLENRERESHTAATRITVCPNKFLDIVAITTGRLRADRMVHLVSCFKSRLITLYIPL